MIKSFDVPVKWHEFSYVNKCHKKSNYSRPDGEFINVEVTNANGDLDLGYVDFQGNLSKFIPLGNPRIFSVGSPASDVAKVELSKIDKSDMDAMSDLESLYAGFREGSAPDKDEWFSGYKLVIR